MERARVLSLGVSNTQVCGVRDAAKGWAKALEERSFDAPMVWCDLDSGQPLRHQRREIERWLSRATEVISDQPVDVIFLHYSVFAFGFRGFPLFVHPVVEWLRGTDATIVGLFHEYAYPFGRRGWRGNSQALAQRLVLPSLLRRMDGVVATTERRTDDLRRAPLLPHRPIVCIPVFTNLPGATARVAHPGGFRVGVLGWGLSEVDPRLIREAFDLVGELDRVDVVLLGAPGPAGVIAHRWETAFRPSAAGPTLSFTGVQSRERLAEELAACDVVVLPDPGGPDSRKGTVAAALAAGRPVLACDGPWSWPSLVEADAIVLAAPESSAIARELRRLRSDSALREELARRGRSFYEREMSIERAAGRLLEFIASLLPGTVPRRRPLSPAA